MKRLALLLTVAGFLCFAASAAEAKGPRHYHHGSHHHYVSPYRAYYVAPVVRPPVLLRPQLYIPAPVYYPPVYRYRYYEPRPHYGFYYYNRGVSLGIGF